MLGPLLEVQMLFRVAGARDCAPCQNMSKVSKTWGFCSMSKNDGRLGGLGADFLRGVAFWSSRSSGLLRWFCVTGAALHMTWHHFFVEAQYFRQVEWKNHKTHWYEAVQLCTQLSIFEGSLAELLRFWCCQLPTLKNEEVSQNCFVFDVVKFKNWGSLAELLRFWCCQVQKLRKSRRLASFSSVQTDRQAGRQTDRQTDRSRDR